MKFTTTKEEAEQLGYKGVGLISIHQLKLLITRQQYKSSFNRTSYIVMNFDSLFYKDGDDSYIAIKNKFSCRKHYTSFLLHGYICDVMKNCADMIVVYVDIPLPHKCVENDEMDF